MVVLNTTSQKVVQMLLKGMPMTQRYNHSKDNYFSLKYEETFRIQDIKTNNSFMKAKVSILNFFQSTK